MKPPEIVEAGDVVLERWGPRWVAEATAAVRESLPELKQFLAWATDDYGDETAREYGEHSAASWAEGTEFNYAILTPDGRLAGSVGLMTRMGPGVLEIGYWLRTSCTGRGYMTAAVDALARIALTLPGIERVAIRHDAANLRSAAVARRAGFAEVGRRRRVPDAPGGTDTEVIRERRATPEG